ncbi:hypothetical protein ABW20_dc0110507 [Dactylellina cionopaga]|nr:hypothetical protein ABW20_dc0110507 [Dactylellina cionopaga]
MKPSASEVVNAQDQESQGPLSYAIQSGFKEGVEWLVEQTADVHDEDSTGRNYFHKLADTSASSETITEIATSLLALGIDWRKRDQSGETPLFTALSYNNEALSLFLVKMYTEKAIDAQDELTVIGKEGFSILHYLAYLPYNEYLLKSILKLAPGGVHIYYPNRSPPLKSAIYAGNLGIANPPSHIGVEYSSNGCVKLLNKSETLVTINNFGWTKADTGALAMEYVYSDDANGPKHVAGCGVNPLDGKIFFTINGKMLPQAFEAPAGRLFPVISQVQCDGWLTGFKANFGELPFEFENANIPGWEWDTNPPELQTQEVGFSEFESDRRMFTWDAIQA